jgi:hypothetical protein
VAARVHLPAQVRHCGEGGVAVAGAREVRAGCATDVFELVERGKAGRATFATNANSHSSRSHLLVRSAHRGPSQPTTARSSLPVLPNLPSQFRSDECTTVCSHPG